MEWALNGGLHGVSTKWGLQGVGTKWGLHGVGTKWGTAWSGHYMEWVLNEGEHVSLEGIALWLGLGMHLHS